MALLFVFRKGDATRRYLCYRTADVAPDETEHECLPLWRICHVSALGTESVVETMGRTGDKLSPVDPADAVPVGNGIRFPGWFVVCGKRYVEPIGTDIMAHRPT